MKRILAILMALALACLSLGAACAEGAEPLTPEQELLNQIGLVLDVRNQMFAIEESAFDALTNLCERNDYASLLTARYVCDRADRGIQRLAAPEMVLSDEVLLALFDSGVETDGVEQEIKFFQTELQEVASTIQMMDADLYQSVYWASDFKRMAEATEIKKAWYEQMRTETLLWVNYILRPLSASEDVLALWEEIPTRWPHICTAVPAWENDSFALTQRVVECNNSLAELNSALAVVVGQIAKSARDKEDAELADLMADVNMIADMPIMFPYPVDWPFCEDTMLTQTRFDESEGGGIKWMCETAFDIGQEQYASYKAHLEDYFGVELDEIRSEDGALTAYLPMGDGVPVLMFMWKPDGQASICYWPSLLSLEENIYILCREE